MGPVNATVRIVCELVALYGIGAGVWSGTSSWLAALVLPVIAATVWGVFRVPDDPKPPPVVVPGVVRLAIEALVLGAGALGLGAAHGWLAAGIFGGVLAVHYTTTPVRLRHVLASRRWGRASDR
ncbi:MAG: DUF2568 domain-containing protein [Microthrixaceae bacterium]